MSATASLAEVDPRSALIVLGCSKRKESGGRPADVDTGGEPSWPRELVETRQRLLARSAVDARYTLPAWRRYSGVFYRSAGAVVGDAVENGRVLILSGGYGIVRGDESISWYDRKLRLSDWPAGVLERALLGHAARIGVTTVVSFVSRSGDYYKLLRRTPWHDGGVTPYLVTIESVRQGAQVQVPKLLAQAFTAFWRQTDEYPPEATVT